MNDTTGHRHSLGTVSLVLGVAGLLPIPGLVGAIAAVVCGHVAAHDPRDNPTHARTGMILGWLGIVAPIVFLFVYCVVLGYPFPIHRYQPQH
jgi:hypothetical protein